MMPYAPDAKQVAIGFNVFLLDFSLTLVHSFPSILFVLPFEMGMFTLCHCILDVCNFLLTLQVLTIKSLH
jgi:hypothetical protein